MQIVSGIVTENPKPTVKEVNNQPWVVRDNELDCFFGPFETELEANTWLSDHEETEELWDADVIQLLKPKK